MAYDTQADFAAAYRVALVDPDTGATYRWYRNPNINGGQPINVLLHYHRLWGYKSKESMADRLIAHSSITSNDSIILVGGAFGWTGEWIEQKTGASVVSVDTSSWINADQANSGDDELREAIIAGGLDPDSGFGLEIFNKFSDPLPRCRISGGVINEDMSNNGSRQRIIAKLPKAPTLIITEEMWQLLTPAEQTEYADRLTNFGVAVVHVIDNQIINGP